MPLAAFPHGFPTAATSPSLIRPLPPSSLNLTCARYLQHLFSPSLWQRVYRFVQASCQVPAASCRLLHGCNACFRREHWRRFNGFEPRHLPPASSPQPRWSAIRQIGDADHIIIAKCIPDTQAPAVASLAINASVRALAFCGFLISAAQASRYSLPVEKYGMNSSFQV